jgi:hypothetical protein
MIVVFKKSYSDGVLEAKPGNIVKMNDKKANDLLQRGILDQYSGQYPPRFKTRDSKTKIQLKDLK